MSVERVRWTDILVTDRAGPRIREDWFVVTLSDFKPSDSEMMKLVRAWGNANLKKKTWAARVGRHGIYLSFENERDALAFKLVFSE